MPSWKKSLTASEKRQLVVLGGAIFLVSGLLVAQGDKRLLPYIGLCIAVAGIAISIQQFYIYSLVDEVINTRRRPFYSAASYALLTAGGGIFLISAANLIATPQSFAPSVEAIVAVSDTGFLLYRLGMISGFGSFLAITMMTLTFLYPDAFSAESASIEAETSRKNTLAPFSLQLLTLWQPFRAIQDWLSRNATANGNGHHAWHRWPRWAAPLWWALLALITAGIGLQLHALVMIVFMDRAIPAPSVGYTLYYPHEFGISLLLVGFILTALLSAITFIIRARQLLTGNQGLGSLSLMSGFLLLAFAPPLIQLIVMWLDPAFNPGSYWGAGCTLMVLISIVWLAHFWLGQPELERSGNATDTVPPVEITVDLEITPPFWIILTILALMPFLAAFSLQQSPDSANFPWFFASYAFLALACAATTASDLETASTAFKSIVSEYISDNRNATFAHEILNPLRFPSTWLGSDELRIVLQADQQDIKGLEHARNKLSQTLPTALKDVNQAREIARQYQKRQSIFSDSVGKHCIAKLLRASVNHYQNSHRFSDTDGWDIQLLSQPSGDWNAVVHPRNFDHIIRILLDNAIESSVPERKNTISLTLTAEEGSVAVRIHDQGRGMTSQQQADFGRKQQSSKPLGTGVGTATARGFALGMHGDIEIVTSTIGKGTHITLRLKTR